MPRWSGRPRPPRARTCAARTPTGRRRSRAPSRTRARPRWRTAASPLRFSPGNRLFPPPNRRVAAAADAPVPWDLIHTARAVARIRLTPQKHEFFELYAQASANAVEIARLLVQLLDHFPDDGDQLIG